MTRPTEFDNLRSLVFVFFPYPYGTEKNTLIKLHTRFAVNTNLLLPAVSIKV